MSVHLQPSAKEKIEADATKDRNKRYVQIDGVGVGIAGAAGPFLPVFLTRLGATAVQVGLLTSMPGITGLLFSLLVGRFLQRKRNIVPWYSISRLIVILAYALTGLVPFFVPDNHLVLIVLIIWAVTTLPQTVVSVSFNVVMNEVAGPEGRYDLMGRRWAILGLTTAVTIAIVGQVLDRIGFHLNYQIIFVALSLGGFLSYSFSSRIKIAGPEQVKEASGGSIKSSLSDLYQLIHQSPDFASITLKQFVYLFGVTLGTPLFPLYFVRQLNASDSWIGLLYTAQTVILVIGYFFWAHQSHRSGSRFVLLFNTLGLALYPGLVALSTNQTLIFIISACAGIFQAGNDLVFFDELMKTIPPRYSPTFVSLAQSIQYLSSIFAPLISTYLSVHIGLSNALLFSTGIRLVGFFLFARQSHRS